MNPRLLVSIRLLMSSGLGLAKVDDLPSVHQVAVDDFPSVHLVARSIDSVVVLSMRVSVGVGVSVCLCVCVYMLCVICHMLYVTWVWV